MMRFRRCQWRWHLDYEMGGRSRTDSPAMAFGDALHKAAESLMHRDPEKRVGVEGSIEIFEKQLSSRMELMPQWQVLGYWDLDEDSGKEKWIPPPDRAEMSGAAYRIMTDLSTCPELRNATYLVNELQLKEVIDRTDGKQINFSGFVDFIFQAPAKRGKKTLLYICDFKSCSWGWPVEKKRDDKEVHAQIFLYKHFVCKILGIDPADVRTVFILLKKKPFKGSSSVEFFQLSSGPKSMEMAIEMLQEAVTGMSQPDLTKNRKECINRWEVCPYMGTDDCPSE